MRMLESPSPEFFDKQFPIKRVDILHAIEKRIAFHQERLRHWTELREASMDAIREHGVSISVQDSGSSSSSYTTTPTARVVVDQELQQRIALCGQKITSHEEMLDTARAIQYGVTSCEDEYLRLVIRDIQYFLLHNPQAFEEKA